MGNVSSIDKKRKSKTKAKQNTEPKDTRTITCYTKNCPDYRRERPYTEKCGCGGKPKPIIGGGH